MPLGKVGARSSRWWREEPAAGACWPQSEAQRGDAAGYGGARVTGGDKAGAPRKPEARHARGGSDAASSTVGSLGPPAEEVSGAVGSLGPGPAACPGAGCLLSPHTGV